MFNLLITVFKEILKLLTQIFLKHIKNMNLAFHFQLKKYDLKTLMYFEEKNCLIHKYKTMGKLILN